MKVWERLCGVLHTRAVIVCTYIIHVEDCEVCIDSELQSSKQHQGED